ncbi:hypothetical protein KPH14_005153 [Odynerus spinipes]|uniref:Uncharacterized protein n=1 Tax=Odynerus spinipes TaxID=1348599 RepID=A0AAD9RKR0_9HYME|nr:hypothetical protein KPH14_005153 [Odynerus spinipes]
MASVDNELEELMGHLGEFGKYQFWQFCLHIVGALTAGLHMLSFLTVGAVPGHECVVPLPNSTSPNIFDAEQETVSWNASTILPRALDSCNYLDEFNETRKCEAWNYDTKYIQSSLGMEWDFVCSRRWMGAMAQSAYMFGVFAGAVTLDSSTVHSAPQALT